MQHEDALLREAVERFAARKLSATPIGHTINVQRGAGPTATKANIEIAALARREAQVEAEQSATLAWFVDGVACALSEPRRSRAGSWAYEQAAARVMLAITAPGWALGVAEVMGAEAWGVEFAPGLVLSALLELDGGRRPITRDDAARWGVTDDRVYSAARSMLFHRSRERRLAKHDEAPGVARYAAQDGFDAARACILPDLLFTEIDEASFRFAIPDPDTLLVASSRDLDAHRALAAIASERHAEAPLPLSPRVWRLTPTRPVSARADEP